MIFKKKFGRITNLAYICRINPTQNEKVTPPIVVCYCNKCY